MSIEKSRRKRRYFWGTIFMIILLSLFVFTMDFKQNPDLICGSCHSMQPQLLTWQVSSHSQTSCIDCHMGAGLEGMAETVKDLARYTYKEVFNDYVTPIRMFIKMEDDQCISCHRTDREVSSKTGHLIIPHQLHNDRNVRCEACHASVAHGGIARRGETVRLTGWDVVRAEQAMAWENTAAPMEDCMRCHNLRRLTNECSACHDGLELPEYHLLADFPVNHGPQAGDDLQNCTTCHGFDGNVMMDVDEETRLANYARENPFCASCHRSRPPGHDSGWFIGHGAAALNNGEEGCLVCHDIGTTSATGRAFTQISCSNCHPSSHSGWNPLRHRPQLTAGTRPNQSCYRCHVEDKCGSCHLPY